MFDALREFLHQLHSPEGLEKLLSGSGPYVLALLFGIVFAETGLLIGFFLPGDSLLFMAGIVAARGVFDPLLGIALVALAAVVGDQVGFVLGRRAGHAIFAKGDGRFIKKRHFEEAHAYFVKHGPKSLVLARFVPVLRTFVPFVAGVAEMPYRSFVFWNILGGVLWVTLLMGAGTLLGGNAWVKAHLTHLILAIVLVSALPLILGVAKRLLTLRYRKTHPHGGSPDRPLP